MLATSLARYQFELNSDTGGRVFLNGTEISPSYDSSVLPGVCFISISICPQVPPFFHSVTSIQTWRDDNIHLYELPQEFALDSGYIRSGSVLSMEADLEQGRLEGK